MKRPRHSPKRQGLNPVASGLDDLLQRLAALRPEPPSSTPSVVGPVQLEGAPLLDNLAQRHELHAPPSTETEAIPPIDVEAIALRLHARLAVLRSTSKPLQRRSQGGAVARRSRWKPLRIRLRWEYSAPPIEIESVASAVDTETAALPLEPGTGAPAVSYRNLSHGPFSRRPSRPSRDADRGTIQQRKSPRPACGAARAIRHPDQESSAGPGTRLFILRSSSTLSTTSMSRIVIRSTCAQSVQSVRRMFPPIRFEAVNPLDLDINKTALPIEVLKTPEPAARNHSTLAAVAVAMLALLLSGAAGWLAWSQWPMNAPRRRTGRAEIPQAAPAVVPSANPSTPAPAPAPPPADAPVQSSEVSEPVPSPPQEDRPEIVTNPEPTPSVARAVPDPEPRDTRPAPAAAENTSSRPLAPPPAAPTATSTTGTRAATPPTVSPTPEANPAAPESSAASAARPSDVPPRTVVEEAPRPAVPAPSSGVS